MHKALALSFAATRQDRNYEGGKALTSNHRSFQSPNSKKISVNNSPASVVDSQQQQQLQQHKQAIGNEAGQRNGPGHSGKGFDFAGMGIQPKLRVNQPGDAYEQEADSVAEQVTRTSAQSNFADSLVGIGSREGIGHSCTTCKSGQGGGGEGHLNIRRASSAASNPSATNAATPKTTTETANDIINIRSSGVGSSLDDGTRQFMESRFGYDFRNIKIHTDGKAARSASDVNALAYTMGNHVIFAEGQYRPNTVEGKRLLAHELTHTIQQRENPALQAKVIQRDLAVEPTVANPADVVLTAPEMRSAIRLNSVMFTDAAEIEIVRDVLGISKQPAAVDEDFVNAVIRYQSSFGLTPDGKLGPLTADRLSQEITAEADYLGDPATGTPMRRVARRLHLRSMTSRRSGTMTHQGFVGPDDNPEGAVTVRVGDRQAGNTNMISMEYTGENSDNVDWLQFINMQMFATPPGAAAPVFNVGAVATTGGNVNWSDAATTRWFVDAVPPPASTSPLYNVSGFLNTRAAARRLAMFDEPGGASGLPVAQAFTSPGALAAGATRVTMRMRFDSYVIRNNRARYHVSWTATTTYDTAAGTSSNIVYAQGAAGSVTGLTAAHRAALLAEYAGSAIR